jgi:hypothetical protein
MAHVEQSKALSRKLNRLLFSPKQQRRAKQQVKLVDAKKEKDLIDYLLSFGAYTSALFIQLDFYLFIAL